MKFILFLICLMTTGMATGKVNWQNNPVGAVFAREGGESPEGTFRLMSGGIEVYTLITSDATEFYQPASLFYGKDNSDEAKVNSLVPDGKVPSSMNCFLVRKDGRNFLFDTGLPASRGGMTLNRLKELNLSPDSIDVIFITHSHFDHIGGLVTDDGKAAFPNSKVYISSREMEFMKSSMSEMTSTLEKLYGTNIITFEEGTLLEGQILPIAAPGHTPGHTVFKLNNLLFAGDILHGMALQLIDPTICANFDIDREMAVKSREEILRFAASESLTVLGAHVPNNGVLF